MGRAGAGLQQSSCSIVCSFVFCQKICAPISAGKLVRSQTLARRLFDSAGRPGALRLRARPAGEGRNLIKMIDSSGRHSSAQPSPPRPADLFGRRDESAGLFGLFLSPSSWPNRGASRAPVRLIKAHWAPHKTAAAPVIYHVFPSAPPTSSGGGAGRPLFDEARGRLRAPSAGRGHRIKRRPLISRSRRPNRRTRPDLRPPAGQIWPPSHLSAH